MASFRVTDCTARRAPGRLVRRIDKIMRALIHDSLAEIGISYPAWATLKMVREGIVGTAGEVARELGYTSGATTRLLDGLETRGALERVRDAADRRVVRLSVTEAGVALVDRGMPVALGLWNEMIADFTQDEADRLVELLTKLAGVIEARACPAGRAPTLAEAAE